MPHERDCLAPEVQWYRPGKGVICKQAMIPFFVVSIGLLMMTLYYSAMWLSQSDGRLFYGAMAVIHGGLLILIAGAIRFVKQSLLNPLSQIRVWVSSTEKGDFALRMPSLPPGEFNDLAMDINGLAGLIQGLNEDLAGQVAEQTKKLERKGQALELLYEVVTSSNRELAVRPLLSEFMRRLVDVYGASSAAVRIRNGDVLELVESFGKRTHPSLFESELTIRAVRKNWEFSHNGVDIRNESICDHQEDLVKQSGSLCHSNDKEDHGSLHQVIFIPLMYRDSIMGSYQIVVDLRASLSDEDTRLLRNIGQHLGAVLQQSRSDEDAGRLIMVEERTRLANDLHDSLAQTLASLRFQTRVLDETLHQGDEQVTWEELEKLENQVDEANHELRRLIGQFRAPLRHQEVVVSIKKLIEKFRQDTGLSVFLQNEWSDDDLSVEMRSDVIGIVQEALANIRKHANAENVRVLIRRQGGRYRVMIEDDGRGILQPGVDEVAPTSEHFGLQIMRERAANLGAELKIESEPDEGCVGWVEFQSYR